MVFEDGFYYVDFYLGNILVKKDGILVLFDFGVVVILKFNMWIGLLKLIEGVVKNDSNGIIDVLKLMEILVDEREVMKIVEKVIDVF